MRGILRHIRGIVRKMWTFSLPMLLLMVSQGGIVMGQQEETSSLTTVTTQDGYVFDIRAASHWEETQLIYCQVLKDGKEILPLTQIDISYGEVEAFEFTVYEGTQGFGVLVKTLEYPNFLALYDVNNRTICSSFSRDQRICEELWSRFYFEHGDLFGRLLIEKGMTYTLTRLKTTSGYVFSITSNGGRVERAQGIYCQVIKQKDLIFPLKLMMFTTENRDTLTFTLIEGDDDLVAITEQSHPHGVVALYDLKHRKLWSSFGGDREIGEELLERLNRNRPVPLFRLHDE